MRSHCLGFFLYKTIYIYTYIFLLKYIRGVWFVYEGLVPGLATLQGIPSICSILIIVITPVFIAMAEFQIHVG